MKKAVRPTLAEAVHNIEELKKLDFYQLADQLIINCRRTREEFYLTAKIGHKIMARIKNREPVSENIFKKIEEAFSLKYKTFVINDHIDLLQKKYNEVKPEKIVVKPELPENPTSYQQLAQMGSHLGLSLDALAEVSFVTIDALRKAKRGNPLSAEMLKRLFEYFQSTGKFSDDQLTSLKNSHEDEVKKKAAARIAKNSLPTEGQSR